MTKTVSLSEAEEVLKIRLRDLLADPDVRIKIKVGSHGEVRVNPQEMMDAHHRIEMKQKERNGKA